uniref:BTB domain-containing protein n=1 Tax=Leersia perrieri TaxID=77586 RepID=A0A0D9X9U8_9ORYZ
MPDSDYAATNSCAIGSSLSSDAFSAGGHTWKVVYYPRGEYEDNGEYLSVFLNLASKSNNDVKAVFEAFLMEKHGKPSSSVAKSDLESSYVVDGKVRIMCVVIVLHDNDPIEEDESIPVPESDIGIHLGGLLDREDGTDISFIVDGETFHAHRAVLAARSSVFQAELFGSMAEAKMSSITILEIERATFKALLQFIYTDKLPEVRVKLEGFLSPSMVTRISFFQDLLVAADRYDLSRLKLMCAQKLWEAISVDNVVTALVCAEEHGCPELKKRCLNFLARDNNFKKAVLTEGYFQLMPRFPGIIDEIRASMIES